MSYIVKREMASVQPPPVNGQPGEARLESNFVKIKMSGEMRKWSALLGFILAIVIAPATSSTARDSSRVKTILVLGDSLSDGFLLKRSEAYPALLAPKLRAAGLDYEIVNASQSGGTTEGGLRRLPPLLRRKIDIFILELGINDVFHGLEVAAIRDNLQAIIDRVRQNNPGVRIVIAGMEVQNYVAEDYVSAFGRMFEELAQKNRAALVPSILADVLGEPSLTLPDRLHPNQAGQKILAENVWRVLEPVAREVSAKSHASELPGR
jgi:acyl-CoA thioesterase-1